jgi:hypothetical protein
MALTSKANVSSRSSEYLRVHRYRITLWIAAIEGLLVLLHVIPHIAVYVLAIGALAFWVLAARNFSSTTARQLSWIFAASQCLVLLVPILLFFAKWIAILSITAVAVAALFILFADRDRS